MNDIQDVSYISKPRAFPSLIEAVLSLLEIVETY